MINKKKAKIHGTIYGINDGQYGMGGHTNTVRKVVSASSDPTVNDDVDLYPQGSIWIREDTDEVWIMTDETDGAAVWKKIYPPQLVDDTTPQLGGNLDCNTKEIQNCPKITDDDTHMRKITPTVFHPRDGYDMSASNDVVAYYYSVMKFGSNSKTSNAYAMVHFTLPDDYKDGEDFTLHMWISHQDATSATYNIDYRVRAQRMHEGGSDPTETDTSGTWSVNGTEEHSVTITGTDFDAGQGVRITVWMECQTSGKNTYMKGWWLEVPVEEYD